jgi:uncharacterized protein YdeI (YjbR/CyaY-like superfamily)
LTVPAAKIHSLVMPKIDPRVDAYIANAADFAKPILKHLRKLVHQACPDVEETIKWSFTSFTYKGILCGLASFKNHCTFGFWKSDLVLGKEQKDGAMGSFGRLTKLSDLPSDAVITGYIKKAMKLNDEGVKVPRPARAVKKELVAPDYFISAVKKNRKALQAFENFSYSHKKEYVEWVSEAKREETRAQRLATAVQWLSQGKSRNWKYENC